MFEVILQDSFACYESSPFDMLSCALDDMALAAGGAEVFGLLVGGMTMLVFYVASKGRLGAASTVTVLIGGIMMPTLPAEHQAAAVSVMFLGLVAGLFQVLRKISQ